MSSSTRARGSSIVTLLAAADWVEFAFVRDQLGLSDSVLSKQLSTLEDAGYVTIQRPPTARESPGSLPPGRRLPRTSRRCARS
jgi:DNA-binding transcriptional ArsR family regulator